LFKTIILLTNKSLLTRLLANTLALGYFPAEKTRRSVDSKDRHTVISGETNQNEIEVKFSNKGILAPLFEAESYKLLTSSYRLFKSIKQHQGIPLFLIVTHLK